MQSTKLLSILLLGILFISFGSSFDLISEKDNIKNLVSNGERSSSNSSSGGGGGGGGGSGGSSQIQIPTEISKEPVLKISGGERKVIYIQVFFDFNSPFTKPGLENLENALEFLDSTDELKYRDNIDGLYIYFTNFPLEFSDPGYLTAQAGECVFDSENNEGFLEFFENLVFDREDLTQLSFEGLVEEGIKAGVSKEKMVFCLENKKQLEEVEDDISQGKNKYQISGVPTFVINNDKIVRGAESTEGFIDAIREVLDNNPEPPTDNTKLLLEKIDNLQNSVDKINKEISLISKELKFAQEQLKQSQTKLKSIETKIDKNQNSINSNFIKVISILRIIVNKIGIKI